LLALSGNRYCYSQIKRSLSILKRAYAQFYWDKWRRVSFHFDSETHLLITDALQKGDLPLATRLLEEDIYSFSRTL
jgi:DNA-binding GntR family transcriptional regulator